MNVAENDETIPPGQIPSDQQIGRQVKRLKVAQEMSNLPEFPSVTQDTVGQRATSLTAMGLQRLAQTEDTNEARLFEIVQLTLQAATQPGGSIHALFQSLQQQTQSLQQNRIAAEARQEIRYGNSRAFARENVIQAFPNQNGEDPVDFPATVGGFWRLGRPQVVAFLNHVGLPTVGGLPVQRQRWAR
jgi:hypothetical protein